MSLALSRPRSSATGKPAGTVLLLAGLALAVNVLVLAWPGVLGRFPSDPSQPAAKTAGGRVTTITIGPEIQRTGVKRMGINLSGQTFYDSGQMMRNLIFRNPGFEGETWQSFLHCVQATDGTCTDENVYSAWPADFLDGARFEVISGAAQGASGLVRTSSAAGGGKGITLTFASPTGGLADGDFLLVEMEKPGDAAAGWWTSTSGGATIATEFHDLAPGSPGKQSLRLSAAGAGQYASVSSYFDSSEGRSFLQLRGPFRLRFRARGVTENAHLSVAVARFDKIHGSHTFLSKDASLGSVWSDYKFEFSANEDGSAVGTLALTFAVSGSGALLDDVELTPVSTSANVTAFRDPVVEALEELRPGIVRFMDNGTSFGSTLDDLLAPPFARRRGGWHQTSARAEDIPIGLHEALVLAQTVHAEPWYTLPATLSPAEMGNLMEYLAGTGNTTYGAKRIALGQREPWTSVFPVIHLEFGNEMWNAGDFGGASLPDPAVYAARAQAIFGAARRSPWFNREHFDLIADGQAANTWLTRQALKTPVQATSIDFAPYLFGTFNDASSTEAIFGSMFSQPEQVDTGSGQMAQQARLARSAPYPAAPAIYEVSLGTSSTTNPALTQADVDRTVPSVGAAIAVADHMLLMLRELGITQQCVFALPEYANQLRGPGARNLTTPLWGTVVDMGGPTNLRRPVYLALELMNRAMLPVELATHLSGANPTWSQPASRNDEIPASQPHLLQVFAFGDGAKRSLILLNLSRTESLPVDFVGKDAPTGTVAESRLTSANITDSNEREAKVAIAARQIAGFNPNQAYALPPFSLTVLAWDAAR